MASLFTTPAATPPEGPREGSRLLPRQLSDAERRLFRDVGERRELQPRDVIFRRGEFGRTMFVIETGRVQLEFGDGLADKLIGPFEFFGELALFIGNHARVASAIAAEPTVLHVIEANAFEALLEREVARATEEKAAMQEGARQAKDACERESARCDAEAARLRRVSDIFSPAAAPRV